MIVIGFSINQDIIKINYNKLRNSLNTWFIRRMKVLSALVSPKNITSNLIFPVFGEQLSYPFRNFVPEIYPTQTRMDRLLTLDSLIPTWHLLLMHFPWITLTNGITFRLRCFVSLSSILKDNVSYVKFSFTCTSSNSITWEGSWIYLRSWDTWKTLWRLEKNRGNAILCHGTDSFKNLERTDKARCKFLGF